MVRTILIAASLAVGLSGCNTAYNYFEEEPPENAPIQHHNFFGQLLSKGGVLEQQKMPVKYEPRAPLAMPGTSDLPPPEEVSSAEQAVNFPEDHDKRVGAEQRDLYARNAELQAAAERRGGRFLPGEMNDGPRTTKSGLAGLEATTDRTSARRLSRQELKKTITGRSKPQGMLNEDGTAAPRLSLVHPPTDYRTPSQEAALPSKKDVENSEWLTDQLYKSRREKAPNERIAPK